MARHTNKTIWWVLGAAALGLIWYNWQTIQSWFSSMGSGSSSSGSGSTSGSSQNTQTSSIGQAASDAISDLV